MPRLLLTILLTIIPFFSLFAETQKVEGKEVRNDYILILNSHSYANSWSAAISKTIRNEIEDQHPGIAVSISYAGITESSSFLSGRFGMQAAFANGRVSGKRTIPSVLILVGDESWMYYRIMNLRGLWENVPIILVDVHAEIMNDFSQFYPQKSISDSLMIPLTESPKQLPATAIISNNNEAQTVELIKKLIPDVEQIVFLSTGGYQDKYTAHNLAEIIAQQHPDLHLHTIYSNNEYKSEAMQQEISELPAHTAVILGTGSLPMHVNVPVFSLRDCELNDDIVVGGYYPSVEEYASRVADVAVRLYEGDTITAFPFSYMDGEAFYFNKTALSHFNLKGRASKIANATYLNIPDPFWIKHMRILFLLLLGIIILIIIYALSSRSKYYHSLIEKYRRKYKKVHDEYQIVYENMPMGFAYFSSKGDLLNRNESSSLFFDKVANKVNFNLFESELLDEPLKQKIMDGQGVNEIFHYDDRSLHLIFSHIQEEDDNEILMIILDYTNIQREKIARKRTYDIFNFAMDASALGVATYNLVDDTLFATDAWYENLCNEKDRITDKYHAVIPEDRKKIEAFRTTIGEGEKAYFTDTVRVKDGDTEHWILYVAQLLVYKPAEGYIVVAELVLNVDEQKRYEQELNNALRAAKESDRLKNAFIANMSCDIRTVLDKLVVLSNRLIEAGDDVEKTSLMSSIEQNNNLLLTYVEQIIELSKNDVTKQEE